MNKSLAKKGTTLNKNMTNAENLIFDHLEVTSPTTLPVYVSPNTPSDSKQGSFYLKKKARLVYKLTFYADGAWH